MKEDLQRVHKNRKTKSDVEDEAMTVMKIESDQAIQNQANQ